MKDKIILYQVDKLSEHHEVRIKNETVCVNCKQNSNVSHKEPAGFLVVSKFPTTDKIDTKLVNTLLNAIMGVV